MIGTRRSHTCKNFLALPLQFSTVCSQFAYYSVPSEFMGLFPKEPQMLTAAESGFEADRFVNLKWTV